MSLDFRNPGLHLILALLAGIGLGLVYAWRISPVTYVDAGPAILRADFKDQYRVVISASYASTHDLPRARARLDLLGDTDEVGELSAQAQRMLSAGEPFERVRLLAQLATDLQQGFVSFPFTVTPLALSIETPLVETPFLEAPFSTESPSAPDSPPSFAETPLAPSTASVPSPRPSFTPPPPRGAPFTLVGQDPACDPSLSEDLLQVILMDSRRRQIAGVELNLSWEGGENRFFTGLKSELGNGYADFQMQPDTIYSLRVEGGSFVPDLKAPVCTNPAGGTYPGSLLLTFQQP